MDKFIQTVKVIDKVRYYEVISMTESVNQLNKLVNISFQNLSLCQGKNESIFLDFDKLRTNPNSTYLVV